MTNEPNWGIPGSTVGMLLAEAAAILSVLAVGIVVAALHEARGSKVDFDNITLNFIFLIVSAAVMLMVIMAFVKIRGGKIRSLGLVRASLPSYLWVLPAMGAYLSILLIGFKLVEVLFPNIDLDQLQDIAFLSAQGNIEMLLAFVALIIIAPISEEITFRGFLFGGLKKKLGWIGAAVISSLVFALVHGQLNVAIDTFLLGLVLAWLYRKTKSIWPSIALHAIKNSIAFYLLFFSNL